MLPDGLFTVDQLGKLRYMDPTLARYPFLEAAREAVTESGSSLEAILGEEGRSAAVDRALERINRALSGETVGEMRRDNEVELLSYPIARILVSLVDDRRVTNRYVQAEGRTAAERFQDDLQRHRGEDEGMDHAAIFDEFDIDAQASEDGFLLDVIDYLSVIGELDDERWGLVNCHLHNGLVPITEQEFPRLLEAAVRLRVGRDLPLVVPEGIAERLGDAVEEITAAIGTIKLPTEFPVVDPAAFPPCMTNLVERTEAEEDLSPSSRYALASFLTSLGLAPEALNHVIEEPVSEDLVAMAEAVGGDEGPTQFPPGTCDTMVAYGDCVNKDELCARIDHPLEYYDERLEELSN